MIRFSACTLCLLSFLLLCCKASHSNDQSAGKDLHSIVQPYVGNAYQTDYNVTKQYALCQEKRQGDAAARKFKYVIVRLSDFKIIHQGTFQMGHVRWINDDAIEVQTNPDGAVSESSEKKIINVNSSQQ